MKIAVIFAGGSGTKMHSKDKGEAWGLIGTNGSGKSTMLKAINGILKPYKGSITVKGTVAPLIELGADFDGNLTALYH